MTRTAAAAATTIDNNNNIIRSRCQNGNSNSSRVGSSFGVNSIHGIQCFLHLAKPSWGQVPSNCLAPSLFLSCSLSLSPGCHPNALMGTQGSAFLNAKTNGKIKANERCDARRRKATRRDGRNGSQSKRKPACGQEGGAAGGVWQYRAGVTVSLQSLAQPEPEPELAVKMHLSCFAFCQLLPTGFLHWLYPTTPLPSLTPSASPSPPSPPPAGSHPTCLQFPDFCSAHSSPWHNSSSSSSRNTFIICLHLISRARQAQAAQRCGSCLCCCLCVY